MVQEHLADTNFVVWQTRVMDSGGTQPPFPPGPPGPPGPPTPPPGSSGGSTFTGYYPPGTVADLTFTVEYNHPVTGEPCCFTRTLIGETIGNHGPTATADVTQENDGPWEVKVHLQDDDSELIYAKVQPWTPEQWFWGSLYGSSMYPSSFIAVEGTSMGNGSLLRCWRLLLGL